jgi:hypothetical protein
MNFANCRTCAAFVIAFFLLLLGAGQGQGQDQGQVQTPASGANGTVPGPTSNRLQNGEFECDNGGYYIRQNGRGEDILLPNGWTLAANGELPIVSSARIWFEGPKGSCFTDNNHVERIGGRDSFFVRSLDIETPPAPGKPFDVAIYQQAPANPGTAYSLSGWQLTLCGGSAVPNDCPDGYYMAKLLGIDPTGGTDINSPNIVWSENRNNFVDAEDQRIGWSNVRTSVRAQSGIVTVFARINSPFRWHGNHGFIDSLSLVEAPVSSLQALTATVSGTSNISVTLAWGGALGGDIPTVGGSFALLFDVQYWHPHNGDWRDLQEDFAGPGTLNFTTRCMGEAYQFRVRARAEQPQGTGVWPNQRYPGVWSTPISVFVPGSGVVAPPVAGEERIYMPMIPTVGSGC